MLLELSKEEEDIFKFFNFKFKQKILDTIEYEKETKFLKIHLIKYYNNTYEIHYFNYFDDIIDIIYIDSIEQLIYHLKNYKYTPNFKEIIIFSLFSISVLFYQFFICFFYFFTLPYLYYKHDKVIFKIINFNINYYNYSYKNIKSFYINFLANKSKSILIFITGIIIGKII